MKQLNVTYVMVRNSTSDVGLRDEGVIVVVVVVVVVGFYRART